jgi:hypothetical protein
MERVFVSLTLAVALGGAVAQAVETPAARNLAKTRPGSFLKRDKLWDEPADLRGESERRRDRELVTHYRRMAELDVLAAVARDQGDVNLQERVEDVRRKEVERHHKVMIRLKRELASTALAGAR